jgi:hypothetical protein
MAWKTAECSESTGRISDAAFAGFGDDQGAGDDERFFVGQGEAFAGADSGQRRWETGGADDGGHHHIHGSSPETKINQAGGAGEKFDV